MFIRSLIVYHVSHPPRPSRSSAASCIPPSCVHGAASMQRGTEDAKSMHKTTNYKTIRIRPPSPGILLSEGSDDVLSNCMHHARTGRVDEAMFRRPPCVMKSLTRVVSIRQYLYEPPARRLWRRPRGALCASFTWYPHTLSRFPPSSFRFPRHMTSMFGTHPIAHAARKLRGLCIQVCVF